MSFSVELAHSTRERAAIASSIGTLLTQLTQMNDDLDRLEKVYGECHTYKDQLSESEDKLSKPNLTSHNWGGMLSDQFSGQRQGEIKTSYQLLSNEQLSDSLTKIKEKIDTLKANISNASVDLKAQSLRVDQLDSLIKSLRRETSN